MDGSYIINLEEYESIETYWIALYVNVENVTSFDSSTYSKINLKIHKKQKYHNKYL